MRIASKELTLSESERIVTALSGRNPPVGVVLDLSALHKVGAGAAWRVACALRRLSDLEVVLPEEESRDSRFWNFIRSGLGEAIARYAHRVVASGQDVTDKFGEKYRELLQESQNSVQLREIRRLRQLVASHDEFVLQATKWLTMVNLTADQARGELTPVHDLCFEAITNVVDHAARRPLPLGTPVLGRFALRYYSRKELLSMPQTGYPAAWLVRLQRSAGINALRGVVEVIIVDDGIGIAARQSQDADIYWRPWPKEQMTLSRALAPGATIKSVVQDYDFRNQRPGYGFTNIAASLQAVNGLLTLRTGRCQARLDGAADDSQFALAHDELGYLPGTGLEIMLPVWEDRRRRDNSASESKHQQLPLVP